ncbi:MAG: RHS repeat-associated core domain-containing protein [Hyphomicrobiaceae bacterium]
MLGRFGTPDPMTENPFSTQGWNRYAYVGNSPLNFTDPSGYCFMGGFWQPIFKAIGKCFREGWRALVQSAATMDGDLRTGGADMTRITTHHALCVNEAVRASNVADDGGLC